MELFSFFDSNGAFVIPGSTAAAAEQQMATAVLETGAGGPEIATEEEIDDPTLVTEPVEPPYRESEYIASMITEPRFTVVLYKMGRKAVSVVPVDVHAATFLQSCIDNMETFSEHWWKVPSVEVEAKKKGVARWRLNMDQAIAPRIEDSALYKQLEGLGLNIVVAPSLANWVKKEAWRRELEMTNFELPEIADDRPLYERAEPGLLLSCIKSGDQFSEGKQYLVTEVKAATEDQLGSVSLANTSGGTLLKWPSDRAADLAEYFKVADSDAGPIYDPEKCVPKKYENLVNALRTRLDRKGFKLFEHTKFDVCQAATKSAYFNGKPMRMGKTGESIAYMWLRNVKRAVFICPRNVVGFVEDELKRLGISDYGVIDDHRDVPPRDKQPWIEIVSYGWLKGSKDSLERGRSEHCDERASCPHCAQSLERWAYTEYQGWSWTDSWGYLCRNPECSYTTNYASTRREKGVPYVGAAWGGPEAKQVLHNQKPVVKKTVWTPQGWQKSDTEFISGSGYIDFERLKHIGHMFGYSMKEHLGKSGRMGHMRTNHKFHGRQCNKCGFVPEAWKPARYRRYKKRWSGAIVDEGHALKSGNSDIALAIRGLHPKTRALLTGTLMPNEPADAYWPLQWTFGNGTYRFPYSAKGHNQREGMTKFNSEFCQSIEIVKHENGERKVTRKRIPFLKAPRKFHLFMAPKMIRRSYDDPMVKSSFEKAGFIRPIEKVIPLEIEPNPAQGRLMLATMEEFDQIYKDYQQQLIDKGVAENRTFVINSSYVMTRMSRMKMVATCPDYLNMQLQERGIEIPIYTGPKGGCKMDKIFEIVLNKTNKGEKVLILSNVRLMQRLIHEQLSVFNPILFPVDGGNDARRQAFEDFNLDPSRKVFIAGPMAIGVGTDLAANGDCNTCICTDLLWRPGDQIQAWSRILKATLRPRDCEIFLLLTKYSLDFHIHNTFYAKLFAAEQALDRRIITKTDREFNVQAFVDQVMGDRAKMMTWIKDQGDQELDYLPLLEMLQAEEREV